MRETEIVRYGVLGTGVVGQTLATKLVELGHEVKLGSRVPSTEKALAWVASAGERASEGSFADAAAFGEVVMNVTAGVASLDALRAAGAANLADKILIDVANPLDFSKGMPPTFSVCNDDSLGEQIQRFLPDTRVVKAFNAANVTYMVEPAVLPNGTPCSSVATTWGPRPRCGSWPPPSGGRPRTSSTSATSLPPAAPRCTSCCG